MPTEPNQKMEQLLQTYARQRREQAGPPLELQPGTRQVLQDQVTRTFQHSGSHGRSYAWALPNFWPRLLLGGAGLALLLIGAGLWLGYDRERETKLAQARERDFNFFAPSASQPGSATSAPIPESVQGFELAGNGPRPEAAVALSEQREELSPKPAAADGVTKSDSELLQQRKMDRSPLLTQAAPPVLKPADESSTPVTRRKRLTQAEPSSDLALPADNLALNLSAPQPTAQSAGRAMRLASASRALEEQPPAAATAPLAKSAAPPVSPAEPLALRFERVDPQSKYRQNLNSPPSPKVLTVFEVQRIGQNVRVVDADGSVYSGVVEAPPPGAPASLAAGSGLGFGNQQQAPFDNTIPALVRENAALPPFSFRAAGTNRTLNQLVVLTGEFGPASSSANQAALSTAAATLARPVQSSQQLNDIRSSSATLNRDVLATSVNAVAESNRILMPGRIEGRASVGPKDRFSFEAHQVGP